MSTTTDTKQRQYKLSQEDKSLVNSSVQHETTLQVSPVSYSKHTAENANTTSASAAKTAQPIQLRIGMEQEEKKEEDVMKRVYVPFKINSRPRFDSSDDDDDEMEYNYDHDSDGNTNDEDDSFDSEMHEHFDNDDDDTNDEEDSFDLSLSDNDDDDNNGHDESEPDNKQHTIIRKRSTLRRQKGMLNLLNITIFDDVHDNKADGDHLQCPLPSSMDGAADSGFPDIG